MKTTLRNKMNEMMNSAKSMYAKMRRTGVMILTGIALSMVLTSCEAVYFAPGCDTPYEQDYKQSKALSGQWTGNFGMYYSMGNRYFDAAFSDVVFYPEYYGATYGYGKQVDWYDFGPYEYIYHRFEWELRDGIVYLEYPYDHSLDCFIRDYRMTNDYLSGYFGNSDEQFRLRKIVDHYNWTPYVNTYSCGNRRDWMGARQEINFDEPADTLSQDTTIVYGNRFMNK